MAQFLTDSFTGVNGTNLEAHTGEVGATWTSHPATGYVLSAKIIGNRIHPNGGLRAYYASGTPASADYAVEAIIHQFTAAGNNGPCGRMDTVADTMYGVRLLNTGVVQLFKLVAATITALGTYTLSPGDGSDTTLRLEMRGSALRALVNGTERITATDTDITAAGRAGVRLSGGSSATTGLHMDSIAAIDTVSASAALAGSGTVGASGTRTALGVASLSGTGTLSASATRQTFGIASVQGTGLVAASGFASRFGAAAISGSGLISATGRIPGGWPPHTDSRWLEDAGERWPTDPETTWPETPGERWPVSA